MSRGVKFYPPFCEAINLNRGFRRKNLKLQMGKAFRPFQGKVGNIRVFQETTEGSGKFNDLETYPQAFGVKKGFAGGKAGSAKGLLFAGVA